MTNEIQQLISAVTTSDSALQMVAAVKNLVAAKNEAAIPTLITVFGYNNPAAATVAVAGLIELGDIAVPQLLAEIDDYNYGARAYSIRTLAAIADPRALDVLLTAAATDFAPSVRRAAAKGLGCLHWQKLDIPERQIAQAKALETLLFITQDSDWSIRYAAVVGLQALLNIPELQQQIQTKFKEMLTNDDQKAVRARVLVGSRE